MSMLCGCGCHYFLGAGIPHPTAGRPQDDPCGKCASAHLLDRVLGDTPVVFWICPDEDNAIHRGSTGGEKVRWVDTDGGMVPVCMVCGTTGTPRGRKAKR